VTVCRHTFCPDPIHEGYEQCCACGTYHSTVAPPAEDVYTPDYWSHERGHSTPEEQAWNCEEYLENGISKNQYILDRIVSRRGSVLEIGCSPGALLNRLRGEFDTVLGVDVLPCPGTVTIGGLFPDVTRDFLAISSIDCIIGCDVLEHSHNPEGFVMECARLMKDGGQIILMLPLAVEDIPERMFHPTEHVWLFSIDAITALLSVWGFTAIELSRWTSGHEVISARWSDRPVNSLRESSYYAAFDEDPEGVCM
jgi:SAM-dependent methyltransferase